MVDKSRTTDPRPQPDGAANSASNGYWRHDAAGPAGYVPPPDAASDQEIAARMAPALAAVRHVIAGWAGLAVSSGPDGTVIVSGHVGSGADRAALSERLRQSGTPVDLRLTDESPAGTIGGTAD